MTLSGRVAIVTGASMGLGAAIARKFASAGAQLVICARNMETLEEQKSLLVHEFPAAKIVVQKTDITSQNDVDALFAQAVNTFGKIDILVNNAGIYGPLGAIDDIEWPEWLEALSINLVGTVYCCRKAVETFKPNRYGKIINISGGGATNPLPGISAYAAAKAGLVRFTETLALEVKAHGIDVNAIAPGVLATRLTEQLLAAGPAKVGSAFHQRIAKLNAEGGTPLSIGAELCAYLASAESDGLTGRLIAAQWDPWPFPKPIRSDIAESDIYTLRRIVPADRGKTWDKT